jgi:hypothetical protein
MLRFVVLREAALTLARRSYCFHGRAMAVFFFPVRFLDETSKVADSPSFN